MTPDTPTPQAASSILRDGFEELFATPDFELAAFMMTPKNAEESEATLSSIVPWQKNTQRPNDGSRFLFQLKPATGKSVAHLRQLELQYLNRGTVVEPCGYHATRRQLRSVLDRHINEERTKRNTMGGTHNV